VDRLQAIIVITGAGYGAELDRLLDLLAEEPERASTALDWMMDVAQFEEPAADPRQ
jgi:hypothetical protein